jgi:cytochrome-b5 reductase
MDSTNAQPNIAPHFLPMLTGFFLLLLTWYIFTYGKKSKPVWHSMKHVKPFLANRKTKYSVKLTHKTFVTHDTIRFRFSLGNDSLRLGLPVGKCLKVFGPNIAQRQQAVEWNPKPANDRGPRDPRPHQNDDMTKDGDWKDVIERKYTPCTLDSELGYFEFTIKVYKAGVSNIFPDGGKMSQYMESLQLGDALTIQGPFGKMQYKGRGNWKGSGKKYGERNHLGLICGGSGVTPMIQVIQAILSDPQDNTTISMLYANKTLDDIIIKAQLDEWSEQSQGQFTVHYTLDSPPEKDWSGYTGFVSDTMIQETLPPPSSDALILMCGPPPMITFACLPNLEKLKYDMKNGIGEF